MTLYILIWIVLCERYSFVAMHSVSWGHMSGLRVCGCICVPDFSVPYLIDGFSLRKRCLLSASFLCRLYFVGASYSSFMDIILRLSEINILPILLLNFKYFILNLKTKESVIVLHKRKTTSNLRYFINKLKLPYIYQDRRAPD